MKIDSIDHDKLRKCLVTSKPFLLDGHPQGILHIRLGTLSTKEIKVDSCKSVEEKQLQQIVNNLLDGLYKPLAVAVLTMKKLMYIYSRVILNLYILQSNCTSTDEKCSESLKYL